MRSLYHHVVAGINHDAGSSAADDSRGGDQGLEAIQLVPVAPTKEYSRGSKHSALVKQGLSKKKISEASRVIEFANQGDQDLVRTVFSSFSRGRNSASVRELSLGWRW